MSEDKSNKQQNQATHSFSLTIKPKLSTDVIFRSQGRTQGVGGGVKIPLLSLIFYKKFITFARRLIVFAYFLLVNLST